RWNGREPVIWTTTLDGRELLVETIRPPRVVAIFGAGRDVEPVARLSAQLGWQVAVIPPHQIIDPSAFDAAVIMTHNFMQDLELLEALLPSAIPYVGLLGPKSRGDELLARAGRTRDARLHNPIGLDLGA